MMGAGVKHLFFKELTGHFKTPLGYVFLVIFLFGAGHLTFEVGRGSFFYVREASLDALFRYIPWMLLFLVPAVSMRMWAEERKTGTIELLLGLPITLREAVSAKFLASWAFIALALAGTWPMVVTVIYLGNPDLGVAFLGYVASLLVAGFLLAVGGFFSALTKNQVVSFILSAVVSFLLLMSGSPPVLEFMSDFLPKYCVDVFESMSVLNHFDSIRRGVFGLDHLWFFVTTILFWPYGTILLLEGNKVD